MNNLAIPQHAVNPINLTTLWTSGAMMQPLMQEALLKKMMHLLTNTKERQQFLEQLQAIGRMPFSQQNTLADTLNTLDSIPTNSIDKEADRIWLAEVEEQVTNSLTEFEFTLERLSRLIYLSPRQIRRRLKRLTGKTFSQYLKEARLKEAYNLLINQEIKSIKKLAYQVGLRDVKHFSKQFKQHFGDSPSVFLA